MPYNCYVALYYVVLHCKPFSYLNNAQEKTLSVFFIFKANLKKTFSPKLSDTFKGEFFKCKNMTHTGIIVSLIWNRIVFFSFLVNMLLLDISDFSLTMTWTIDSGNSVQNSSFHNNFKNSLCF